MIETASVPARKSSVTFRNLRKSSENVRKIFGNVLLAFGTILKNLRNLRKLEVVGNLRKIVKNGVFSMFT